MSMRMLELFARNLALPSVPSAWSLASSPYVSAAGWPSWSRTVASC